MDELQDEVGKVWHGEGTRGMAGAWRSTSAAPQRGVWPCWLRTKGGARAAGHSTRPADVSGRLAGGFRATAAT